ncbi:MAG: DUF177 domain-containing protein [Phascolarctobacterium sp.]|uniref:YceD family protein n=1 Tax=Phascolarctobacterium sp. TaxID=2049039 RepID=UPI0026DB5975|nr:DUF177 domain-containing protein [Phascolarctobacterium sp.]MDO4920775.1 DUF177 domain-containing protein [Phascolarctobacterium sp.]
MIKINVAEIKKRLVGAKNLAFELEPAELEITPEEMALMGSVRLEGTISNVGDVLLLKARLSGQVKRTCGRCLKEFTAAAEAEVVEKFYPAGAENIENDAFVYDSDVIEITEPLREGLLLAEPMQALCKPDCRGLCPVCGADLNEGDCGCDRLTVDPRLAALKQFIKN